MNHTSFKFWNRIAAWSVFVISLVTYSLTLEPTASFWDCGEFIASSYKLEVGHPPGNPVFQLIARFFSMFTGAENAAVAINWMSGLCSALTIFFLYLTIVFFAKRLFRPREDGSWSLGSAVAIIGSGVVGALAYAFSDTFWFSAVEAEVYAMSSLFTALVFWAMTRWYDEADAPHADRWIVLVFFLMGLSIGVHLLNLLAIPALVFLYAYRKREQLPYGFWQLVGILGASVVLLGFLVFAFIPYLPKVAAAVDRYFVNGLGLPYNLGAACFMALLLAACFLLLFRSRKKGRYYLNLATLCFTTLVIGFSLFTVVIIRSSVKTPTNEYQPDNPYTLVRYLSREQYGSAPLIYGEYFGSEVDSTQPYKQSSYYAPLDGRYEEIENPGEYNYAPGEEMFFPRMWSPYGTHPQYYVDHYVPDAVYYDAVGRRHYRKPSQLDNFAFFLDYQLNWMYWRYFLWNFAGRQNDIHGQQPNTLFGNWESGIGPLDRWMLGDGELLPDALKDNPGKNHYYLLPLLLGIIGLMFQFDRDRRGSWLVFLMFFMTGIAIVLYLNQPPMQVRERDYAYAGSFYFFAVWIGLGVAALWSWLRGLVKSETGGGAVAAGVSVVCLLAVPVLMAAENWDDHDRSHRYTAVEMARNYLNSVGKDGMLVTHGDNDTFPLWYAQEVEGVRTDIRILNTSLLGTDWHIDQMLWAVNESAPLTLQIPHEMYLYGRNESIMVCPASRNDWTIYEKQGTAYVKTTFDDSKEVPVAEAVQAFIAQPTYYYRPFPEADYQEVAVFPYRRVSVPVNKENAVRAGILDPLLVDEILGDGDGEMTEEELALVPDSISLTIPSGIKTKPALFLLDLLAGYQWDRPLNMLPYGSEFNIGQDDYMMYTGYSSMLVPLKKRQYEGSAVYADMLYRKLTEDFTWEALSRTDYYADYQNQYTFLASSNQRLFFYNVAKALFAAGEDEKVLDVIERCLKAVPKEQYSYETIWIDFDNNDALIDRFVWLCCQVATQRPDLQEKAVAMADSLAAEYGRLLAHNAAFTQNGGPLYSDQSAYCDEILYLLHTLCESRDLPHDEAVYPALVASLQQRLVDLLCGYEIRSSQDIKDMQELFGTLRDNNDVELVPVDDIFKVASCHARLLGRLPAESMTAFSAITGYAFELEPILLSDAEAEALHKAMAALTCQCRAKDAYELNDFLTLLDYLMTDLEWVDEATAATAITNQKGLLQTVASGDTLDDLYELAAVVSMLDGMWTSYDIARGAKQVQSKVRAVYNHILKDPHATTADLREFGQYLAYFVRAGFLTEEQAASYATQ